MPTRLKTSEAPKDNHFDEVTMVKYGTLISVRNAQVIRCAHTKFHPLRTRISSYYDITGPLSHCYSSRSVYVNESLDRGNCKFQQCFFRYNRDVSTSLVLWNERQEFEFSGVPSRCRRTGCRGGIRLSKSGDDPSIMYQAMYCMLTILSIIR